MLEVLLAGAPGSGKVPLKKWTKLAPPPKTTYRTPMVAIEGKLYLPGIYNFTDNYTTIHQCYDIATNTWSTLAPVPFPSGYGHAAVALGGKMYVLGGYRIPANVRSGDLWCYDPVAATWTKLASGPTVWLHQMVAHNGKIYTYGGTSSTGNSASGYQGFNEYNPVTNTWRTLPPIENRQSHGIAVLDEQICVFAGFNVQAAGGTLDITNIRRFDLNTETWDAGKAFIGNSPRYLATGVIDDVLYLRGKDGLPQEYTYAKGFKALPAASSPGTQDAACAVWDGVWYVQGGFTGSVIDPDLFSYQPFSK